MAPPGHVQGDMLQKELEGDARENVPSPRPSLSLEHEELRRALQHDLRNAIRQFAASEIMALRKDVQELLARTRPRDALRATIPGGRASLDSAPGGTANAGQGADGDGAGAAERPHEPDGSESVVESDAGMDADMPAAAYESSHTRVSIARSLSSNGESEEGHSEAAGDLSSAAGELSSATRDNSMTTLSQEGEPYKWEWERSGNKGWAPYSKSRSKRIEKAWRNGYSRVRLRSGQEGQTPMEIFLVDMLQFDPISMRQRRVRRIGRVQWWRTPQRHFRALMRELRTGDRRWESFEEYKHRQELVMGPTLDVLKARMFRVETQELERSHSDRTVGFVVRKRYRRIVNSEPFSVLSMAVTVLQAVWIGVDVDKNFGRTLYQKPVFDIFLDHFFCVFFAIELFMRFMTYKTTRDCWKNAWFCFDTLLVLSSVLEVLVIPPLVAIADQADLDALAGLAILRIMRLVKIIRIFRIFGASSDAMPFFKGLLSGMRSAAFIWGLLLALLYMFSVLLRLNAHRDLVENNFSTVGQAMITLMTSGVMLDDVADVVDGILKAGDTFTFINFSIFVFLAHFNLLNMLVGAFCSVAGDVSASEKDAAQIAYLRENLACIVDCYIQDEGKIGRREFDLIMKNADVHRTLVQCGTDMEELAALESLLFHKKATIGFDSLFKSIVHLRKGKVATVKDIMHVQGVLGRQLDGVRRRVDLGLEAQEVAVECRKTSNAPCQW